MDVDGEIIFVNDGSPERHREVLRELAARDPRVRPERMLGRSTNSVLKNPGWARRAIISFSYAPLVVLFMGGIQLLCLSIIGSYVAHMYEEVKARPAYIVDEILNRPTMQADGNEPRPSPARTVGERPPPVPGP